MRKFLGILIFLIILFPSFSSDFPDRLSNNAKISIISVNYTDLLHYIFSKNCMRFYDKENEFDEVIDFAFFDDFEDDYFGPKFFLKSKKAKIKNFKFMDFYLYNIRQTNVSLIESVLDLTPEEIRYIFDFVSKLNKALPDYEYDFDLVENNSETHIAQILNDCKRMLVDKEESFFSFTSIKKHILNYKKLDDSFVLLPENESIDFTTKDFFSNTGVNKISFIAVLSIIAGFFLFLSVYQMLVFFMEKVYIYTIFKLSQVFDFLILFVSGFSGSVILFQDIFSEQILFRNNFQFMYLFPLHFIASFTMFYSFSSLRKEKIAAVYWGACSFMYLLYVLIVSIINKELPIVSFFIGLIIFFRTVYYALLNIFSILKKNGKIKTGEVKK